MSFDNTLSNQVRFLLHKQPTFAGGPATTPAFTQMPRTSGDITDTMEMTQSQIVDPSRQARANALVGISVEGSLSSELQVADPLLKEVVQGVLQNELTTAVAITDKTTISFDATNSKILDSADGMGAVTAGMYIAVYGSLNGLNDQVYFVKEKTDNGDITVSPAPTAQAAGEKITIRNQYVTSSNKRRGYTVQKVIDRVGTGSDVVTETFRDCQFSSMSMSASPGSLVTIDYALMGTVRDKEFTGITGQTETPLTRSKVSGPIYGIPQIFENGSAVDAQTIALTSFDVSIENSTEGSNALGSAGAVALRHANIGVTGSMTKLVKNDKNEIVKNKKLAQDETEFQLALVFKDSNNNYLIMDMPNAQYTDVSQANTGATDEYTEDMSYSANGEGKAGYTVGFTFIAAPTP